MVTLSVPSHNQYTEWFLNNIIKKGNINVSYIIIIIISHKYIDFGFN